MALGLSSLLLRPFPSSPRLFSTPSTTTGCPSVRLSCFTANKDITSVCSQTMHLYREVRSVSIGFTSSKKAMSAISAHTETGDHSTMSTSPTLIAPLKTFFAFTRPYSCTGTVLGIVSSSLIAIESFSDISLPYLIGLLQALAAFMTLNIYSTGVNQVFDIEIDKINKPYLPLASGEMTLGTGIAIISVLGLMAFLTAYSTGSKPLLLGIISFFFFTSAYSVNLPLLRWKKSSFSAALSLVGMRTSLQLSIYLHIKTFVLGRHANFPKPLAFGTVVVAILFTVITLFKDIPDIEGDKKFGINSLAMRLGQKRVFWTCIYLLEMVFMFGIVAGVTSSFLWSRLITVLGHTGLALIFWKQANGLDLKNEAAVTSFYHFIWKVVHAEYMLIPLLR